MKVNCKKWKLLLVPCLFIALLFVPYFHFPVTVKCLAVSEQGSAVLCIEPNCIRIPDNETGQQFTVDVSVYRAENVYAYDFKLYYNSSLLKGIRIREGSFLKAAGSTVFTVVEFNDAYNSTHGRIWAYNSLLGLKPGVNGTGTLATVTFESKPLTGLSFLELAETILSDPSSSPIPHSEISGIVCLGNSPQIRVPSDYPTIHQAVNAATAGATIVVSSGTYFENLIIDKTVSLTGENASTTVIDARQSVGMLITANSVQVTGFTIRNASGYAIDVETASFNEINDNIIENSGGGIFLGDSIQDSITRNVILDNTQDGIQLYGIAIIANNTVKSNGRYGINVHSSQANITANQLELNGQGILLSSSGNSILRDNVLLNNVHNFGIDGEKPADFIHDIDDSNEINGKKIRYLVN